jgi:hypothetical protein
LLFGAIPGLTVVDMDQFNEKFRMSTYWMYLVFAIISGLILAIKSKLTHNLCRHSPLRHEAYLSLYASLTVCVLLPALIGVQSIGRKRHVLESEQMTDFLWVWAIIAACLISKELIIDRRLNKRFKEDFDAELQMVPEIVD